LDEQRSVARFIVTPGRDDSSTRNRATSCSTRVLILTSVMFTFIGAWRTAAIVLCDLASTA
jgi:hypothetical protein